MCLAIPGKVIKLIEDKAVIDYGKTRKESYNIIDASVGDYVIVQMDRVIQKVKKKDALKSIRAWESFQ